jgi:hypothetical protein
MSTSSARGVTVSDPFRLFLYLLGMALSATMAPKMMQTETINSSRSSPALTLGENDDNAWRPVHYIFLSSETRSLDG